MSMYSQFAQWYDRIFPFSQGVYAYLRHHLGERSGPVLDLGCGPGDYCAAFSRDGVAATGLDLDPAMISQARAGHSEAEFHVRDMVDFAALGGPWAMIYSVGNTAAHLPADRLWKCVEDVRARLMDDGVWIMQVMNWDYVLGLPGFHFPSKVMDGGTFHREYRDITPSGLTFHTALDIEGRRVFDDEVRLYPLAAADIIAGHEQRGFRLLEHVSDYAGSRFDPDVFSASIFVFVPH